ncbi:MAG: hypothetical protein GY951_11620 [Psychromonas sp.]|nr:hypothetical protein [Alteromonadales bacterium]MCP5078688.1 hypothetical protein [Psychromonas sp.]
MGGAVKQIFILLVVFMSLPVNAHFPLMHCWFESELLLCETGFSDGSKTVDYQVKLYDYEDNLLAIKQTDKRAIALFDKPSVEFYLLFDSGHESPVEVDVVEIKDKPEIQER